MYFIDTQLHPADEISVISYSARKGLTLHEYLTTDYQKARQIVEGLGLRNVFGRAERLEDVNSGSIEQVSPEDLGLKKSSGLLGSEIKRWERNIRVAEKRAYKHKDQGRDLRPLGVCHIQGQRTCLLTPDILQGCQDFAYLHRNKIMSIQSF